MTFAIMQSDSSVIHASLVHLIAVDLAANVVAVVAGNEVACMVLHLDRCTFHDAVLYIASF